MNTDDRDGSGAGHTPAANDAARLAAVIELGTTSVRMVIAQINSADNVRTLESLQYPVSLGKDTFIKGEISREATEETVAALRSFQRMFHEYRIPDEAIRAVATSAVREAANKEAFADRLYIATGINVEVPDEAEVNRFTYFAVRLLLDRDPSLKESDVLVIEVGGGNTQGLLISGGQVSRSHTYRLGSLRLRTMQKDYGAPVANLRDLMLSHMDKCIGQIRYDMPLAKSVKLLLVGGDARFAADRILGPAGDRRMATLKIPPLTALTNEILHMSVDEIARKHRISYPEAETLGPSLLFHSRIAQTLKLKQLMVGYTTLRDGLLCEISEYGSWMGELRQQIINSAIEVGRKYNFDQKHAEHVAELARTIFKAIHNEHRLDDRYELILTVAALLHDIGMYVSNRSHHKHSMYLVKNCDIFGLSPRDLTLTAVVVRYHRKALPDPVHEEYATLNREDRMIIAKLVPILRVADALDRGHVQRMQKPQISFEPGRMVVAIDRAGDLALEQYGLQEKGRIFEQTYGMEVSLRSTGTGSHGI